MRFRKGYEKRETDTEAARRYYCDECSLYFFQEEVEQGRFHVKRRLCARCMAKRRESRGEFVLPDCFGEYEGTHESCSRRCGAAQACIVEMVDKKAGKWAEEYSSQRRHGGFREYLVRGLRAVGRPLHLYEVAILLEKFSGGRWSRRVAGRRWREGVAAALASCPTVFSMGMGFYVWAPLWDFEETDTVDVVSNTRDVIQRKRDKVFLLSPQEILRGVSKGDGA